MTRSRRALPGTRKIATVWIAPKALLHQRASPSMPLRMSVWPVASHTRRPAASRSSPPLAASSAVLPPIASPGRRPGNPKRAPLANSTSIVPRPTTPAAPASGAIRTGAKLIGGPACNWRRQPYSWLAWIPASPPGPTRSLLAQATPLPAAASPNCSSVAGAEPS